MLREHIKSPKLDQVRVVNTDATETLAPVKIPPEAARRTYIVDDFSRWDAAVHQSVDDFHSAYGIYPTELRAHSTTLARFMTRARPENLQDSEGDPPTDEEIEDGVEGVIERFETNKYSLSFTSDDRLWPITIALLNTPWGVLPPEDDTPPPPNSPGGKGWQTEFKTPALVRPLHGKINFFSSQCAHCRWLVSLGSCAAFTEIPLAIAQSRHDHREPHHGDGGTLFEPTTDPAAPTDAYGRFLFHDERSLVRSDGPPASSVQGRLGEFGDTALAPTVSSKTEVYARVRAVIRTEVEASGGIDTISTHEFPDRVQELYPVTVALLRHYVWSFDAWKGHIRRYLGSLRRTARRKSALDLEQPSKVQDDGS